MIKYKCIKDFKIKDTKSKGLASIKCGTVWSYRGEYNNTIVLKNTLDKTENLYIPREHLVKLFEVVL